jgi:hypothetical protein
MVEILAYYIGQLFGDRLEGMTMEGATLAEFGQRYSSPDDFDVHTAQAFQVWRIWS